MSTRGTNSGTFRPIGEVAAEVVADLRYRRRIQKLHGLGPRVLGEMLAELGAERSIMTLINQKLGTYAELDPEALTAAGGNRFPPAPLYKIQPNPELPEHSGTRAITRDSPA